MSRTCDITGQRFMTGNNVSHSEIKTKRRFNLNLQNVTLFSEILKKSFKARVCASTIRTIDVNGGLDSYLLTTSSINLTAKAGRIKRAIKLKQRELSNK
jgi:large subunit ribosomal protein L28